MLGLLATPVPFGLRLRLFLEAKHRGSKTGLADYLAPTLKEALVCPGFRGLR